MIFQINKGNANTQNIENQYNYPPMTDRGTAFVPLSDCREEKYYTEIKDSLYYPPEYLDKIISILKTEHSILIQGEQGSGKSILSFKIAEQMKSQEFITSAYYLNPPSDWNTVKQWVQSVHFQEKITHSEGIHLWIIDNLHKVVDAIEDFPDSSIWGADYCICCTRNLNRIPSEDDVYYRIALSKKQIFRRNIDEKIFLECYNTMAPNKIGRHESDHLYHYIGGNLALLRYIITSGNLPRTLTDWSNGQFIDFHNIYLYYFGFETTNRITQGNLDDTLNMLFLSQLDFSIPLYLQCDTCQTVLKNFYFEIANEELEMEHASLAELLTVCICKEHRLNYLSAFTSCIHWTLSNLVDHRLEEPEQIRQINRFLQSLYSYQFVLNQEQTLQELLSYDECLTDFLEKNVCCILPSTWKKITAIADEDSKINDVFHQFATSTQFIDTICSYCDYDLRFFKDRLSQAEPAEVDAQLLARVADLMESIVKNGTEVHLMHLLLSLSEETAHKFIEQIPAHDLVSLLSGNRNGLFSFARYYSLLGNEVQNILAAKISTDDYRHILMTSASICGFVSLLAAATDSLRKELCRLLTEDDLSDRLIQNTIEKNYSIGALGILLRELKRNFTETLTAFESAISVRGYGRLLRAQGTILVLADLTRYSSAEMQIALSKMMQSNPQLVQTLLERTINEGHSIGTIGLSIRELKRTSAEAPAAFEGAIGVKGYERLLKAQGSIPVLARLISYSSPEMQIALSRMLQSNPQLVQTLLERTINEGHSIGTIGLSIRELKRTSAEALTAFEDAISVRGYERLLRAQGTILVLANLTRYSSAEMQIALSKMLQSNPLLVQILLDRTINEGHSIGTIGLAIRELKRTSMNALTAFEDAIGIEGYKRLLYAQGTISVLSDLIRHSTKKMQKKLFEALQLNPELTEILLERTIEKGSSIGTLYLFLKDLKWKSPKTLAAFENAIGIIGYEKLLQSQGTIPILVRLIQDSSTEMQKELARMLQSNPELVQTLLERTVEKGSSIGTLDISLRTLGKENLPCLQVLENSIGVDGYFEMFSKCNTNTITIMRIMACSSLSDSLVDKICANIDIWQESRNHISEDSCTILTDFNNDLFYAKKMNRKKFFDFIKDSISAEEWLNWMRRGATLEEAILIMRNLPFGAAKRLSNIWLQNDTGVIEDLLLVEQQRTEKQIINPQAINRAIWSIRNYNMQLFVLLDKEYRQLCPNHDGKS